jgi:hypothetical protein
LLATQGALTWASLAVRAATPGYPQEAQAVLAAHSELYGQLCGLIRCLFGNPFPPALVHPSWLTPDVVTLAGHIDCDRAFGALPELADALEDAGATDATLLGHLRTPGPHALGCHVLDAVLGKW